MSSQTLWSIYIVHCTTPLKEFHWTMSSQTLWSIYVVHCTTALEEFHLTMSSQTLWSIYVLQCTTALQEFHWPCHLALYYQYTQFIAPQPLKDLGLSIMRIPLPNWILITYFSLEAELMMLGPSSQELSKN